MSDSQSPPPRVGAWARRIAAASPGTKATSLGTVRVDHAAWPMPSLRARRLGINRLAARGAADPHDLPRLRRAPARGGGALEPRARSGAAAARERLEPGHGRAGDYLEPPGGDPRVRQQHVA